MMKYKNLPSVGLPTDEEKHFTNYLLDTIADYIEKIPTDRRVLIAGLSRVCQIVFCKETPMDIKKQCEEIDSFCNFLKSVALKDAKRS